MWEAPATDKTQDYKEELKRYKQTENYQNYSTYLEKFRQEQRNPEPTTTPDYKFSCTSESSSPILLPASQVQKEFEATGQEYFDVEDLYVNGQSQDVISSVRLEMEEVRRVSKAFGVNLHLIRAAAFPPEHLTTQAVEAFLYGTGSLLYFWGREEAVGLVKSVYQLDRSTTPVHATEVFAMSVVGSYCDPDAHSMSHQRDFLNFFLHLLSSSSDMSNLRCMRSFTCLAIYRFTDSVGSARRLLCKRPTLSRFTHKELTARSLSPKYWTAKHCVLLT
jgi:hypothetical protein